MSKSVAILIDADNVPAVFYQAIFQASNMQGTIATKRAFGDFTQGNAKNWMDCLLENNIVPYLNVATGSGKNAADISLVLNAMDLLHANHIDVFCLVSSDSDFTPLAMRIREQGKCVLGFGEDKTTAAFRTACHDFTILKKPAKTNKKPGFAMDGFDKILSALKELDGDRQWISLSPLGKSIKNNFPDICYSKLGGKTLKPVIVKMAEEDMLATTTTNKGFSVKLL